MSVKPEVELIFTIAPMEKESLQCSDTVGWAAGRASSL